ncbi:unnamed protein product [Clonostachys rosea]|uniref:Uncharacterized protein n=1 Tax=Bionectria ochroleuca TaxID=29856 RepID=A0ABY6TR04_BIOOC|nr:unnamed protein product [Clonostachys rosea]
MPSNKTERDKKKEARFRKKQLELVESLLRPLLSKLSFTLKDTPATDACYRIASREKVVGFLDEYFNRTEVPLSSRKASVDQRYEQVIEIMRDMDDDTRLLDLVCQTSSQRTVRDDLRRALYWWRHALYSREEAEQDPV